MNLFTVEFRIEGDSLVPNEITKILNLSPCLTSDMVSSIKKKVPRISFWAYDGISNQDDFKEQNWETLEEGLLFVVTNIEPKYKLIKKTFSEYKIYFWCGYFQNTFDGRIRLSSKLIKKLSNFNIELIIKTYQEQE